MTKTRSYNRAMPSYEYACLSCGQHVEVYQRFSDPPLSVCGVCGGQLRKVFHPAGILFKGSGFYATDNRRRSGAKKEETGAGKTKADSSSSDTGASSGGSSGSSTSSKPDAGSSGSSGSKEK